MALCGPAVGAPACCPAHPLQPLCDAIIWQGDVMTIEATCMQYACTELHNQRACMRMCMPNACAYARASAYVCVCVCVQLQSHVHVHVHPPYMCFVLLKALCCSIACHTAARTLGSHSQPQLVSAVNDKHHCLCLLVVLLPQHPVPPCSAHVKHSELQAPATHEQCTADKQGGNLRHVIVSGSLLVGQAQ